MILIDHIPISYTPGSRSAERAIAGGQSILVRVARQTTATPGYWGPGVSLAVQLEVSSDGGNTWRDLCGMASEGGIVPDLKHPGQELAESRLECHFPEGINRARVTVTVAGGTLASLLTVESI